MQRLTISIDSWQKSALETISKNQGISISELLRSLFDDYLKSSKPSHLRPLTETPDEQLNDYDKAVKAWCDKELKKMAEWYLDDIEN